MWNKMQLLVAIIVYGLLDVHLTEAQSPQCVPVSTHNRTMLSYECTCTENLPMIEGTVNTITINQTEECKNRDISIDWKYLGNLKLSKLVIIGANLVFQNGATPTEVDVSEIVVLDSVMTYLPSFAFIGLTRVKIIRFVNTSINIIQSNSFQNLRSLSTIEFVKCNITTIQEDAFTNLLSIHKMSFSQSNIDEIQTGALSLKLQRTNVPTPCVRGRSDNVDEFMGRSLISAKNISLPNDGGILFMHNTSVGVLSSSAIITNVFPYIILGGNHFYTIKSKAFDVHLDNDCNFSAFLSIQNRYEKIDSYAFQAISGPERNSSRTLVAFSANTFVQVEEKAFLLSDSLEIYDIGRNTFVCDCSDFGSWILSNEKSTIQKNLEKSLVSQSVCEDGRALVDFVLFCQSSSNSAQKTQTHNYLQLSIALFALFIINE